MRIPLVQQQEGRKGIWRKGAVQSPCASSLAPWVECHMVTEASHWLMGGGDGGGGGGGASGLLEAVEVA